MTDHHRGGISWDALDCVANRTARGVPDFLGDRSRFGRDACAALASLVNPGDSIADVDDAAIARAMRRALQTVEALTGTREKAE